MFQLVIELDGTNVKTDFIRETEEEVNEIANKIVNNEYDTQYGKDYDMHCYGGIVDIGKLRIRPADEKHLSSKTITGVKVLELCEGIKINKKSWHYRFNKFARPTDSRIPNNLCGYFWSTLAFMLLWSVIALFIGTMIFIIGDLTGINNMILSLISTPIIAYPLGFISSALMITLVLLLIIGLVWLFTELEEKFDDWNYNRKGKNAKLKVQKLKEKSKSIAVESMKSFKSKHCPLIEFNEE